jgi:hypothetical protein
LLLTGAEAEAAAAVAVAVEFAGFSGLTGAAGVAMAATDELADETPFVGEIHTMFTLHFKLDKVDEYDRKFYAFYLFASK